ncbi:hypothetical protein ABZT02_39855 [Streptomyces sp. NPDC005402]|uniref:hypothetical protein n=1 Tax=Streptomyces sp. NPDC005402 TaxID=3155338 RepID=UPI0033BEA515
MGQKTTAARRSAGTQTVLDVLLRWTWIRRRTPAQDIEDYENGQTLRVVGFTKNIGGVDTRSVGKGKSIARLRQGYLRLAPAEAPVWSDRRGDRTATLHPPFQLRLTAEKVPLAHKFDRYELVAADGTYDLVVPKMDGKLIRHVLLSAEGG